MCCGLPRVWHEPRCAWALEDPRSGSSRTRGAQLRSQVLRVIIFLWALPKHSLVPYNHPTVPKSWYNSFLERHWGDNSGKLSAYFVPKNFGQLLRVIVKVVGRSILEWLTAISTATDVIYSNFGELEFTSNHVWGVATLLCFNDGALYATPQVFRVTVETDNIQFSSVLPMLYLWWEPPLWCLKCFG